MLLEPSEKKNRMNAKPIILERIEGQRGAIEYKTERRPADVTHKRHASDSERTEYTGIQPGAGGRVIHIGRIAAGLAEFVDGLCRFAAG